MIVATSEYAYNIFKHFDHFYMLSAVLISSTLLSKKLMSCKSEKLIQQFLTQLLNKICHWLATKVEGFLAWCWVSCWSKGQIRFKRNSCGIMLLKPQPCTHFLLEIPVPPATHTHTHTHTLTPHWPRAAMGCEFRMRIMSVRAGWQKGKYIIPSSPHHQKCLCGQVQAQWQLVRVCYCTHVCSSTDWCEYRDDTFLHAGIGLGHTETPINGQGKKAQNDSSA